MAGPVKQLMMKTVVPWSALALIRALGASWSYRETRPERLRAALDDERPLVGAFFHGRLFPLLHYMSRPGHGRWLAMCSRSLDGEAMARVERALGYEVIRGSSGSGGFEALVDMIRAVRKDPGLAACLAVDGSVGPRGHVHAGAIALAQRTGAQVLPVAAAANRVKILTGTWDRTAIPLPFARVHVVFGDCLEVPKRTTAEQTEELRVELSRRLVALQREADELSGFADPEFLPEPNATQDA